MIKLSRYINIGYRSCKDIYRIRKNIGKELNLAIWRIKTKSPIFHLANIFCTRLIQNLFQWHCGSGSNRAITCKILGANVFSSLIQFRTANTFPYSDNGNTEIRRQTRSTRPSCVNHRILSQQNIEVAQKSDADTTD